MIVSQAHVSVSVLKSEPVVMLLRQACIKNRVRLTCAFNTTITRFLCGARLGFGYIALIWFSLLLRRQQTIQRFPNFCQSLSTECQDGCLASAN